MHWALIKYGQTNIVQVWKEFRIHTFTRIVQHFQLQNSILETILPSFPKISICGSKILMLLKATNLMIELLFPLQYRQIHFKAFALFSP